MRKRLKVGGTIYRHVIHVLETTQLDDSRGFKWYAPGVGVIQARSTGEILQLVGSTLP